MAPTGSSCQGSSPLDPIPDLLPAGGVCLLVGAPLVGKTALLATILKSLQDGRPVFGRQPNLIPAVGIVCADRSWSSTRRWFELAGCPDIRHYVLSDDQTFEIRRLKRKWDRVAVLLEFIDRLKLPRGSLVAVDPITPFLGGSILDYDVIFVALLELRAGLRDRGLTLVATAHCGKLKADLRDRYLRAIDQVAGSTAIVGFSDSVLYLAAPEETGEPCFTLYWASHLAPSLTVPLDRLDNGLFETFRISGSATKALLTAWRAHGTGPISLGDLYALVEDVPLSQATVKRAVQALVQDGLVRKLRHGVYQLLDATVQ